ncbi:sensor histidine kinase [Streptomyces sp. NBC_01794]
MTGLLDTLVPQAMADHLLAVLREALANAARHADATEVEIAAQVTSAHLTLRVTDNGRGTAPAGAHRSGLANLHTRAEELGGALVLAPNQPTGSVVDWSVPLSTDE